METLEQAYARFRERVIAFRPVKRLAAEARVSSRTVEHLRTGRRMPTLPFAIKIERALDRLEAHDAQPQRDEAA